MAQPNILFMMMDDLGWRDLSCYGSEFYETPNLDRLAARGMQFSDAYASCPVCSPTRASVLTGQYPARVGITNFIYGQNRGKLEFVPFLDHLPTSIKTCATALKEGGYQTWHVGKWHVGGEGYLPKDHGFDQNFGGCGWGMPNNGYFSPWDIPGMDNAEDGKYLTDHLTEGALRMIDERDPDKPFFLHYTPYTVHIPIQAVEEDIERFRQKARDMGIDTVDPFEEGEHFPFEAKRDKRVKRRKIQSDPVYAAMVWRMDWNVGRLLDKLEAEGLADNTLILFTSDNGGVSTSEGSPTCNEPLSQGKGWMYDGGVREPLLASWPGVIEPGSNCREPVTSTDFFPTFLEAAGLDLQPEHHADGTSILPLLKGAEKLDRQAIFWHYPHYSNQGGSPACSLRAGDFKLIEFFEDNHLELYNLRDDISETQNLAEQMPEKTVELHKLLVEWRESVEAKIPSVNPDWVEDR